MAKSEIEIIYNNDDILVVNKPAGISVTADRTGKADLVALLRPRLSPSTKLLLVHRLDKFTSGVMVLAKNTETQSRLSSAFEKRLVQKTYLALITGSVNNRDGTIDLPISRGRKNDQLMRINRRTGKPAIPITFPKGVKYSAFSSEHKIR